MESGPKLGRDGFKFGSQAGVALRPEDQGHFSPPNLQYTPNVGVKRKFQG